MLLAGYRKEEDVDPEQIRKDIERLQLIKQKRLDCTLQRHQSKYMCRNRATAAPVVTTFFYLHDGNANMLCCCVIAEHGCTIHASALYIQSTHWLAGRMSASKEYMTKAMIDMLLSLNQTVHQILCQVSGPLLMMKATRASAERSPSQETLRLQGQRCWKQCNHDETDAALMLVVH